MITFSLWLYYDANLYFRLQDYHEDQQLNHTIQGQGPAILLIHGLFGSLSNLGLLAERFSSRPYGN